jgi:hypothetical protein
MRPFAFALFSLVLVGCVPAVQFDEPMPPNRLNLPNIPRVFRGTIQDGTALWHIGKDTLQMGDTTLVNGVDFLLRKMAGALIVNSPVPETGEWQVMVIWNDEDQMRAHLFEEEPRLFYYADSALAIQREVKQTGGTFGWEYHLLSPSAAEFGDMVRQGLYAEAGRIYPLPNGGWVKPSEETRPTN